MFANYLDEYCEVKTMFYNGVVLQFVCLKHQEKWDYTRTSQEILHILNTILNEFYMDVEFATNLYQLG